MMLSSTMRTLIGGTVPSLSPLKAELKSGNVEFFLSFNEGRPPPRGDVPRAGGGVRALACGDSGAGGIGGVGTAVGACAWTGDATVSTS